MAEQLGEAVLTVRADTAPIDAAIQRSKQQVIEFGNSLRESLARASGGLDATAKGAENLGQAFTKSGKELQTASNGLQYYIDAQGRARDASGRFVTSLELQAAGLQGLGTASLTAGEQLKKLAVELGALEAGRRAVGYIVDELKQLDAGQAAVRTLGVNSEELTNRLKGLSQELGASVSVNELLKASYDVLSSGFTTAADATSILRASALGAQGGFAELGDVVKAISGVLNAYGLSAQEATGIVDTFLQTQNDGVITVRQYAAEIGNIASIAAAGGVSIQELNAAIATATLRGVPVAQTFTGLRQALSSIIKPSDQAVQLARSLGLEYNVAALQSKGFAGVLADVQAKTGGSADKLAILLGSVEAQAAVQPLLNDKLVKFNELLAKQAESAGAASSASKINADTVTGNVTRIQNSLSNLATSLDSTLSPVLGSIAGLVSSALGDLTKLLNLLPKGAGNVTGALAGSLVFGPGVGIEALRQSLTGNKQPKAAPDAGFIGPPVPKRLQQASNPPVAIDPNSAANAQLARDLADQQLTAARARLDALRQTAQLDEVGRARLQAELSLNEKIQAVEADRLALSTELAKPKGTGDGQNGTQSLSKIADLQGKIKVGEVEIATAREQGAQAEAAAVRSQQDRIRQQRIEAANTADKLRLTQEQTRLEAQAAARGGQVSGTELLQLQQRVSLAEKLRQQDAARAALATELAKPKDQQDTVVVRDLRERIKGAGDAVKQAFADAGLSLTQNARQAADALKSAQDNVNGILRGGFEFLTPALQQAQLDRARAAIQPLVDNGTIRSGLDISTPDKLFRLAGFAEQLVPAQKQLQTAIEENARAASALASKDWNVYVQVPGQQSVIPLSPV